MGRELEVLVMSMTFVTPVISETSVAFVVLVAPLDFATPVTSETPVTFSTFAALLILRELEVLVMSMTFVILAISATSVAPVASKVPPDSAVSVASDRPVDSSMLVALEAQDAALEAQD